MHPSPRLYIAEHWPAVQIYMRVLGGNHWGRTVWTEQGPVIYLRFDLGKIARRVTLAHELAHLELGPPEPHEVEENEFDAVDWTARFLIPDVVEMGRLLDGNDIVTTARQLRVTRTVIEDRLDGMNSEERMIVQTVLAKSRVSA